MCRISISSQVYGVGLLLFAVFLTVQFRVQGTLKWKCGLVEQASELK